jgi:hypothetical protein
MDEIVVRSMLKWPEVPSVYGWLALDRRGHWSIKTRAERFDAITNRAVIEFIGRNYGQDGEGRWFFQNGPQRVFVLLYYTPWVYRFDAEGRSLVTHTEVALDGFRAGWVDESGALLLESDIGVGVVSDRDLPAVIERTTDARGASADALLEAVAHGETAECRLLGARMSLAPIRSADVPERFGFVARPAPKPGEPEC